jgi:hypothetical protein
LAAEQESARRAAAEEAARRAAAEAETLRRAAEEEAARQAATRAASSESRRPEPARSAGKAEGRFVRASLAGLRLDRREEEREPEIAAEDAEAAPDDEPPLESDALPIYRWLGSA